MDEVVNLMRKSLADSFAFYLKAHNFHWNVEGAGFKQFHDLFGGIYEEVWEAVDGIAEHIRTLDAYAPGSLSKFSELTTIAEGNNHLSALEMVRELLSDNQKVIDTLSQSQKLAEKFSKVGLSNYLQDRIDAHEKHGWMLRATSKGTE